MFSAPYDSTVKKKKSKPPRTDLDPCHLFHICKLSVHFAGQPVESHDVVQVDRNTLLQNFL